MCAARLAVKDQVLLLRLLLELAQRGLFPWVLEGDPLIFGFEGQGRILVPVELLRERPDNVLATLEYFSKGGRVAGGVYQVAEGSGEFPEEGWRDVELAWLRFQKYLVQRGEYSDDLESGSKSRTGGS